MVEHDQASIAPDRQQTCNRLKTLSKNGYLAACLFKIKHNQVLKIQH